MTNHIYRIALISGLWRLMRDDKLHSTYTTQQAAKDGMVYMQGRDERPNRARVADKSAYTMDGLMRLVHHYAETSPAFDPVVWNEFKRRFDDLYARAYAARKGE